jgi:hypothetical protein
MKPSILKILFVLLIFSGISTAQENNKNLILVESLEKPDCELLLRHLDSLLAEVMNKPQSIGYVVIYGGENSIENIVWERTVKNHFALRRRFSPDLIRVLTAKPNQLLKIETFITINKAKPDVEDEKFSYVLPNEKPILFADDAVSIVKIDKKDDYLTVGCEVCCLGPLDLNILAAFLEANPRMNAEIRIFNKSKKKADKLTKLILENVKENKISPSRLKIKYSGKGKRDASDSSDISDVETWLIDQEKIDTKNY